MKISHKIRKMRFKKSNFIFAGLFIFFFGYFTINYVNINKISNTNGLDIKREDAIVQPIKPKPFEKTPKIEPQNQLFNKKIPEKEIENVKILDNKENNEPHRFFAYDGGGFGSINGGITKCLNDKNVEVEIMNSASPNKADILYFNMNVPDRLSGLLNKNKRQFSMVYGLESEVHSYGGSTWNQADFRMYYNLDKSFPEPATYFDVKLHLADLLSPPKVDFIDKTKDGPIVWVVSNCNAHNGREKFMKDFMDQIRVDSYGNCLKNKHNHPAEHMRGNIELFTHYKFAIAIENSNCEDYVTEKLVHAISSGSIPIVAGKENKPNYERFLPKNSYINILDYNSIDELVKHLNKISSDKSEYEKYMPFKFNHNYTSKELHSLPLDKLIDISKKIIGENELFFSELVKKEKSADKVCKIASYLNRTPVEKVLHEIEVNKMSRTESAEACLKSRCLPYHFNI